MEQEVLKILSSGKSLDRYKKVLHLLNSEDCGEYEAEQPHRKKRFLGWGCIGKNTSVLIVAHDRRKVNLRLEDMGIWKTQTQ